MQHCFGIVFRDMANPGFLSFEFAVFGALMLRFSELWTCIEIFIEFEFVSSSMSFYDWDVCVRFSRLGLLMSLRSHILMELSCVAFMTSICDWDEFSPFWSNGSSNHLSFAWVLYELIWVHYGLSLMIWGTCVLFEYWVWVASFEVFSHLGSVCYLSIELWVI